MMQTFRVTLPTGQAGRVECGPGGSVVYGPEALVKAVRERLQPDITNGYDPNLGGAYVGWDGSDVRHVNACLGAMKARGELATVVAPDLPPPARYGFVDLRSESAIKAALPPAGSLNDLGGGVGSVVGGE